MLKLILKISFVFSLAIILSIILTLIYLQKNNYNYNWPQNVFIAPEIENKYELVVLGNSHPDDAIRLSRYNLKTLKLSNLAQSYEFDYALLKMYHNQIKENAIILVFADPISFSQNKPKDNKKMTNSGYYNGKLSPFLIPRIRISDYIQIQLAPFLRTGYLWRKDYGGKAEEKGLNPFVENFKKQNEEKIIKSLTPTPIANNASSSGEYIDPHHVKSEILKSLNAKPNLVFSPGKDNSDFVQNKWLRTSDFNKSYFETNKKDLEKIIDYSLKNNWRPVIVTLPISQHLIDKIGENYLNEYVKEPLNTTNTQNVSYLNFSNDKRFTLNSDMFKDTDHLNETGGAAVSYLILRELIKMGYIPESADGYIK